LCSSADINFPVISKCGIVEYRASGSTAEAQLITGNLFSGRRGIPAERQAVNIFTISVARNKKKEAKKYRPGDYWCFHAALLLKEVTAIAL